VTDPKAANCTSFFVVQRGGYYASDGEACRSASRKWGYADNWYDYMGFRVVLAPTQP
jgi:formylglycine-generating enzyme required for sulfatase activity